MSGLLFRCCSVRNTHAEQRWYQHVGKRCLNKGLNEKTYIAPLFFPAGLQRSNKISRKSYLSN